uniref:Probable nicotinate-nucleotide pyrophosphorylase [carboxylating] n=1 Tax=Haloferula luteola TaxID=595692 RepID=A0A840UYH4_9BACT|nr:nicotinate-nucleotide pyrophosphorylase (carboxylating) [Haloferula luteola]
MNDDVLRLIDAALAEDIGEGDVTSAYFVPEERKVRAFIVAREEGVLAGVPVAAEVFRRVDDAIDVRPMLGDGARVTRGAHVLAIEGSARSVLTAERTALNFLQRLSGVASATAKYVKAVEGQRARILDTRKTTPGWRQLEKAAVASGGGTNHRMGLYDRVMVKDNHLVAEHDLDSLQAAIRRVKAEKPGMEVELEADSLEQVEAFLGMEGVDHILLDNMTAAELKKAVEMRGERAFPRLEASGGVSFETVAGLAESGVDYISVGAITHSVKALDLGLDFVPLETS